MEGTHESGCWLRLFCPSQSHFLDPPLLNFIIIMTLENRDIFDCGYKFSIDNKGSSNDPCEEDFRGKSAFSEPETQAFRDMFEKYPKIISAMNFHTYGDLWIIPFNYDGNRSYSSLKEKNLMLYNAYLEFEKTAFHPKGSK